MRVLVTGGTGGLGHALVPRLLDAGHTVRVMSRRPAADRPRDAGYDAVEWATGVLADDVGVADALVGVDTVVHAASDAAPRSRADVDGTRNLVHAAASSGVTHLLYVSIIGVDRNPFFYYRKKLAAEGIVAQGRAPWTILRAAQFHGFIDFLLAGLDRLPLFMVPKRFSLQPIAVDDVAAAIVSLVQAGPSGRADDVAGPEVRRLGDLARAWLEAQGRYRRIWNLPTPGRVGRAFRRGAQTAPDRAVGTTTWEDWLRQRFPAA